MEAFNDRSWEVRGDGLFLIGEDKTVLKEFFDLFFLGELKQIVQNL